MIDANKTRLFDVGEGLVEPFSQKRPTPKSTCFACITKDLSGCVRLSGTEDSQSWQRMLRALGSGIVNTDKVGVASHVRRSPAAR